MVPTFVPTWIGFSRFTNILKQPAYPLPHIHRNLNAIMSLSVADSRNSSTILFARRAFRENQY
jgi:hypothetical protein